MVQTCERQSFSLLYHFPTVLTDRNSTRSQLTQPLPCFYTVLARSGCRKTARKNVETTMIDPVDTRHVIYLKILLPDRVHKKIERKTASIGHEVVMCIEHIKFVIISLGMRGDKLYPL